MSSLGGKLSHKIQIDELDLSKRHYITVEIHGKLYDMMECPECLGYGCAFCNWNGFVGDFYGGIGEVTLKYFCNPDGRGKHKNRRIKLTPEKIEEMHYLYEVENISMRKLTELFKVVYSTVYAVVHYQSHYAD